MMIGDQFVESVTGKRVEIMYPATCGEVPSGGKADVDIAVQAAQAALPGRASIPSTFFTCGIETGRQVAAALTMKQLTPEPGGNDSMIICSDVDLVAVAIAACALRMYNCGRICTAPKQMIVLPDIHDAFVSRFTEKRLKKESVCLIQHAYKAEGKTGITEYMNE